MPSAAYRAFREAILHEQQVTCTYDGFYREVCPHIIGHKQGIEKVLAFQFAGQSKSHLPPGGEWRCLTLASVRDVRRRDGPWHTGSSHRTANSCVDDVDLDINIHVRKLRTP